MNQLNQNLLLQNHVTKISVNRNKILIKQASSMLMSIQFSFHEVLLTEARFQQSGLAQIAGSAFFM